MPLSLGLFQQLFLGVVVAGTSLSCPVGGGGCFVGNVSQGWGMFLTNPVRQVCVCGVGGLLTTPRTINKCVLEVGVGGLVHTFVLRVGGLRLHVCPGGGGV